MKIEQWRKIMNNSKKLEKEVNDMKIVMDDMDDQVQNLQCASAHTEPNDVVKAKNQGQAPQGKRGGQSFKGQL